MNPLQGYFGWHWKHVQPIELHWFVVAMVAIIVGSSVLWRSINDVRFATSHGLNGDRRWLGMTAIFAESLRLLAQIGYAVLGLTSMHEAPLPGLPKNLPIPLFSTARLFVPILFAVQYLLLANTFTALFARIRLRRRGGR